MRSPNYRLWAGGASVSHTGTWMQRIAQDWLIFTVLTDNSAMAVGIATGLQFAPTLLLAPLTGALVDRVDRRRLLMLTQAAAAVLAMAFGLLVVTSGVGLWQAYVFAGLLGVVSAFDVPARQAFQAELAGADGLVDTVRRDSVVLQAGRVVGPALAGFLIPVLGVGQVFVIDATTFLAVLVTLASMRVDLLRGAWKRGRVRDGVTYLRTRPDIALLLVIAAGAGAIGLALQLSLVMLAVGVFQQDAWGYGLLASALGVGALAGAALAARPARPKLRVVVRATAGFGVVATIAANMPAYPYFALMLLPVGLAALVLTSTADAIARSRTQLTALYTVVVAGALTVVAPVAGWVGETYGARWTIVTGGWISVALAVISAAALSVNHARRNRSIRVLVPAPEPVATLVAIEEAAGEVGPARGVAKVPAAVATRVAELTADGDAERYFGWAPAPSGVKSPETTGERRGDTFVGRVRL